MYTNFQQRNKVMNMVKDLSDIEKLVIKLASEVRDNELICRIDSITEKYDRYGRPSLELVLYCQDHGKVVLSYSPLFIKEFVKRMKEFGITSTSEMMSKCFKFVKTVFSKTKQTYTDPHPRFLPIGIVSCNDL